MQCLKLSEAAWMCLLASAFALGPSGPAVHGQSRLLFAADAGNDLYQAAEATFGERVIRFSTPGEAFAATKSGDVLFVLASEYPDKPTSVSREDLQQLQAKGVRTYIEYPKLLCTTDSFKTIESNVERVIVIDESLCPTLPPTSLLQVNGLHYCLVEDGALPDINVPLLVAGKVAGFDTAVFGLPEKVFPLLLQNKSGDVLIATTSLSNFRQGRYSPYSSWNSLWSSLLARLLETSKAVDLQFSEPVVTASFEPDTALSAEVQQESIKRGIDWFTKAKMIIHPDWEDRIAGEVGRVPPLPADLPIGDGSLGSMEAVLSIIEHDGHQVVSSVRRGDCICETAMAHAVASRVLGDPKLEEVSRNLLDYWLLESDATKRERGDPEHGAYGLIAWGTTSPAWYIANYGDDNARVMLSAMTTAGILGEDRWNDAIARCIVGNLRTTGRLGFRGDRIDIGPLGANGWQHYFRQSPVNCSPHFESYLWACYLWAYDQTGDLLLLDRARTALEMTMDQYPDGLRWCNGMAQERARILLPLAWLVRVDDTPQHREMLDRAIDGLLSIQDSSGGIQEELGPPGRGVFPPPQSNEAYGTTEASLIARNGDPVADMLYTNNFALVGLHEAAAVSDDPRVRVAEDKLVDFLIRIQAKSDQVPEVDGGWMRAFDFKRWEPWGSNADLGWGAWSIESGWTQGWITTVLALREMDTSMWDVMANADIEKQYPKIREAMLPQAFVDEVEESKE